MSTEYKPVTPCNEHDRNVSMTQYAGPSLESDVDHRRLQLTQYNEREKSFQYLQLSRDQAFDLAVALMEYYAERRKESYE